MSEVCSRLPRERSLTRVPSRAPSEYHRQGSDVYDPVLVAKIRKEIRQERSKSLPRREGALQREMPPTYEIPRPASPRLQASGKVATAPATDRVYSRSLLLCMRPRVEPGRQGLLKIESETREAARPRRRAQSQNPAARFSPSWPVPFLASDDSSITDGKRQNASGKFADPAQEDDQDFKPTRAAARRSHSLGERSMDASARCEEDSWWRNRGPTFSNPDENVRAGSQSTSGRSRWGAFSARLGCQQGQTSPAAGRQAHVFTGEAKKQDSSQPKPCAVRAPTKPCKRLQACLARALKENIQKPTFTPWNLHQGMALWAFRHQQDVNRNPEMLEGRAQRSVSKQMSSPGANSLRRETLALMNKISADNELSIVSQLSSLDVRSEDDLLDMAEVVVDKAIRDSCYVDVYTNVIAELFLAFPSGEVDGHQQSSGAGASFRSCLLVVCQETFHNLRRRMQLEDESLDSCVNMSEVEQEEAHHKLKDQALACCKLLAHLYLYDLVPRQLIEQSVIHLFLPCHEEERRANIFDAWFFFEDLDAAPASLFPPALSLVCLCDVLRLVGPKWSRNQRGMTLISNWLLALQSLQSNAKSHYPPRIRYLIQDLIDLACNAWVS